MSTATQPRYEPPPPAVSIKKSRPGLIGLAAAATMLVLIVAVGNPPATRSLIENADLESFSGRLRASLSTFGWHLTDLGNDFGHLFLANVLMDVAVVLLVFAFVVVVTSGSGSFWRTFLGTWIAVIAASVIGGYVRSSVVDEKFADPTLHSKATAIFFSVSSPGATLVFAGLVFGVFVAIVAGLAAIATRRDEVVTARPHVWAVRAAGSRHRGWRADGFTQAGAVVGASGGAGPGRQSIAVVDRFVRADCRGRQRPRRRRGPHDAIAGRRFVHAQC